LISASYRLHHGDIGGVLAEGLNFGSDSRPLIGVTGRGAKAFPEFLRINEVVAAVEGAKWAARKNPDSLLLIGGENIYLIRLNSDGSYSGHAINTDCASGTGVFLDQQAGRLGISTAELSEIAAGFEGIAPSIATRCAVFAKTDLIHCQQQGHSPAGIAAGLCDGVARCLADTLLKKADSLGKIYLAGGVALNRRVVSTLETILGRRIEVVPRAELVPALGAALLAEKEIDPAAVLKARVSRRDDAVPLNPALALKRSDYPDFSAVLTRHQDEVEISLFENLGRGKFYRVYLGIDIGSTSTKLALMEGSGRVLLGLYTYTSSDPLGAVKRLFKVLTALEEVHSLKFEFLAAGTTGSGRQMIGKLIHADLVINEITAHARAAVSLDPDVDTVIEIGGQDSKFIRVQRGAVVQAIMNYICAAGTGSFIEEQAKRLNVSLEDFSALALGRSGPVISDRCTVYMERDISRFLAEGWPREELMASVLHSVRDNYLMRVVGQAKLGERICFQGATARNKALVAAFEGAIGKPIRVSRFCHLAGALGVCLLLDERRPARSSFLGLKFFRTSHAQRTEICGYCRNRCQITIVDTGDERAAWGFQCGREYEDSGHKEKSFPFDSIQKVYARARESTRLKPLAEPTRPEKIGLPRALPLVEYLPFWEDFFASLGFRTVCSPQHKDILARGKRQARAEFCSPILLAHGHADWLQEEGADFVFFPVMIQGPRSEPKVKRNFFCYYTSYLPVMLRNSDLFSEKKNLLSPLVDLRLDPEETADSLSQAIGKPLRLLKRDIRRALDESLKAFLALKNARRELGENILAEVERRDEMAIVLLGRPYNLLDRSLNRGIPDLIQQAGVRVLTQDTLPLESLSPRYTGDYLNKVHWHYGKSILRAAELVIQSKRLFPVYVTNFRCSPDAFLMNYFKEIMERQGRPYLILQLDELSSEVGYQTRIEAALESFRNWERRPAQTIRPVTFLPLRKDRVWLIPHIDDSATHLGRAVLERFGYEAVVCEENAESIIEGLRRVGGGECVPVAAILGGLIKTVEKAGLPASRTAAIIPTSYLGCNFPQIPLAVQAGLKKAGFEEMKIFTTDVAGQQFALPLSLALLKSYIMGGLINQMTARVRPYEESAGETEEVRKASLGKIGRTIVGKKDVLQAFKRIVADFAAIRRRGSDERRPMLIILGDLYVTSNSAFNRNVEGAIEAAGGEAWPSSFIDISYFSYLNRIEKSRRDRDLASLAQAKALNAFVRYHDLQFRKAAAPVLGGLHPLLGGSLLKKLRKIGIPPELGGESAQNLLKVFYYLEHFRPDGFVHINPLYCCPGVVSRALLDWLEQAFGVPVIHLFYDGIHDPNENLEPYIYYLKKRKEAAVTAQRFVWGSDRL